MSGRFSTYVRLVSAMSFMLLLLGMAGPPASAQSEGIAYDPGTPLTGELTVWEDASVWPNSAIYVGYPDTSVGFTTNESGYNAWGPYSSKEGALDGACRTAQDRANNGWTVTVNDVPFSDLESCMQLDLIGNDPDGGNTGGDSSQSSNASSGETRTAGQGTDGLNTVPLPSQQGESTDGNQTPTGECRAAEGWTGDETGNNGQMEGSVYEVTPINGVPDYDTETNPIEPVPPGTCLNSGLVVLRFVNNQKRVIDVSAVIIDQPIVIGKDGELAFDAWEGFGSPVSAAVAACTQALGDFATTDDIDADGDESWNYGYTVTFMGGQLPSTCS